MWTLANITEEQFDNIYGDTIDKSIFKREPTDDSDFIANYLSSKLWRMNNLYKIVNKQGNRIVFQMNYAQHVVYAASIQHARLIILKSRQQGISTFWLICFLDDAMVYPDFNIGMMAQGKSEASTLLKRTELAWENVPEWFTSGLLGLNRIKDTSEEQGWSNNSYIFIRTSFRSATLQRLHVSEYGKIANKFPDKAKEVKTGTLQAIAPGNTVVIESTAEGDNDFKTLWNEAVLTEARVNKLGTGAFPGESFKPVFLSWVNDPDCVANVLEEPSQTQAQYFEELEAKLGIKLSVEQKNFWVAKYRTLGEEIYQEYPATPEEAFSKVNDGSYYGVIYSQFIVRKGRKLSGLYDPNLPVYVAMDLGLNDTFVLVYFQKFRDEWRIIDEYANSGYGLQHYVDHMFNSGYSIATVYCPHDITVQELSTGKSRLSMLQDMGVRNAVVLEKLGLEAGIEQVRRVLANTWIDEKCTYLDLCIQNYSKEWDEKRGTWKNKPLHDKWSHGADGVRYMAISGAMHQTKLESENVRRRSSSVYGGMAI
jgi:hypothetical protein